MPPHLTRDCRTFLRKELQYFFKFQLVTASNDSEGTLDLLHFLVNVCAVFSDQDKLLQNFHPELLPLLAAGWSLRVFLSKL